MKQSTAVTIPTRSTVFKGTNSISNASIVQLIDTLKNTYGIEVSVSSEYLEDRYNNVYKDIKEMRHILGIKHLMYYLAVKQLKDN